MKNTNFKQELKREHEHMVYLATFGIASVIIVVVLLLATALQTQSRFNELEERVTDLEIGISTIVTAFEPELIENLEDYLENSQTEELDGDTSVTTQNNNPITIDPIPNPAIIIKD